MYNPEFSSLNRSNTVFIKDQGPLAPRWSCFDWCGQEKCRCSHPYGTLISLDQLVDVLNGKYGPGLFTIRNNDNR